MRIFGDRSFSLSGKLLITAVLLGLMYGCGWLFLQIAGVIVLGFMLVFSHPFRSLHYYVNKALFVPKKASVPVGKAPQLRRTFSDYLDYCAQTSPRANNSKEKSQRKGSGTPKSASGFVFPAMTHRQIRTQKWIEQFFSFIEANSALLDLVVSADSNLRCESYCKKKSALVDAVKDRKIEDFLKEESNFFEFSKEVLEEILRSSDSSVNAEVRQLIYEILNTLNNVVLKSGLGTMGSSRSAFDSFNCDDSDTSSCVSGLGVLGVDRIISVDSSNISTPTRAGSTSSINTPNRPGSASSINTPNRPGSTSSEGSPGSIYF